MKSKETITKSLCAVALFAAFVYGLALPFFWGNDPTSELGTLSLLCENRKPFFWLWGVLTSGGIIMNTQLMYKKFSYKNKFLNILCVLGFVSMCCIALTLGHSIADWNPKRLAHWISTGFFIAFTLAPIVLFFIFNIKKYNGFKLFTVISFMILGTFLVIFAVMGKGAVMEMVPLALMELFLFIINFTPLVKVKELQ